MDQYQTFSSHISLSKLVPFDWAVLYCRKKLNGGKVNNGSQIDWWPKWAKEMVYFKSGLL